MTGKFRLVEKKWENKLYISCLIRHGRVWLVERGSRKDELSKIILAGVKCLKVDCKPMRSDMRTMTLRGLLGEGYGQN